MPKMPIANRFVHFTSFVGRRPWYPLPFEVLQTPTELTEGPLAVRHITRRGFEAANRAAFQPLANQAGLSDGGGPGSSPPLSLYRSR